MREWADSEAGDAYFRKLNEMDELEATRHRRFEKWLEDNDFDKLIFRLILEHNDEYIDKCYRNGFQPYPNNKLNFLLGYITDNYAPVNVSELDCVFPHGVWQFRGYYFQMIHGQGTITRIYNKDDMKMLLQI